jgi:signal transduction histidine kinase
MKILVVDDEIDEVESLSRGLRSKGHKVLQALSAQEALNHLQNDDSGIDLLITDYAMPIMNGMELLRNIRMNRGNLPVIMMTAYGQKDLVIDALRNHCDSFIEKPFTLDQLLNEIERVKDTIHKNMTARQVSEAIPMLIHQINNPLACIGGSAEVAILKLSDTVDIMKELIESTRRIARINKEIMQTGSQDGAKQQTVDVKAVLGDCVTMFREMLALKGISIEMNLGESPQFVLGNRFDIEQLFGNLISNAIDSMDGGSQKVLKIRAVVDEDSHWSSISVEDTGCGIPEQMMDKIFKPYFTGKKNGTGLGLAVVKKVVELHKGRMDVVSQPGKGTTFTISLPLIHLDHAENGSV